MNKNLYKLSRQFFLNFRNQYDFDLQFAGVAFVSVRLPEQTANEIKTEHPECISLFRHVTNN